MSNKKIETGRLPYTRVSLILDFLRGSIRYFAISILSALCVTGLDMLSPQLIRTTVDCVLGDNELRLPEFLMNRIERIGGVGYLREHLWLIGGLILLVALLSVAFRYLFMLFNAKGAEGLVETMRNRLFSHIQRLPFSWHMQNQTGDIIQRCTSDVDMVKNFVSEQLTSVFRIIILIALSLVFMFSMNPRLTLVALASIPVIIAYSAYFHSKIGSQFMKCDENEGILSTIAQENLTGVRVVRAFGREKYEKDRFEKQNNIYTDLWIRLCRFMALFWGAGDLISGLQVMLIVILGSVFCVRGGMTAGEFIAFISYNAMLTWPVRSLGRMIAEMSKAGVSIERIRYIMNSAPERDIPGADRPEADIPDNGMPDMHGDIEFRNVSFSYADTPVLSGISFKIPQGTTFGILGGTGSGKSTLMYLLNRLYELPPENGRITIGGVDIANMKGSWVRSHIGMVLQESFLFSRTIAENIGITRKEMSLSDIRWAASIACVDGAICEFTNGYDTVVGERGVTLSGGQKQRTAIARMLTQKTPIMVFDDSLSAVDSETDAKIRQALKKNLGDSTVILISHRVTTLMQAENILVLDKGRIAELGSHEELMKKNGIYRRIYDMQMTLPEEVQHMAHKKDEQKEYVSLPWFGINKLLPYLKPYRPIIFCMIILGLTGGLVDIILPLFQRYALNHFIAKGTLDKLGSFIAAYIAVLAFQVIANTVSAYQACQIEMYVGRDMKRASFNHLQTLAFSYYNQNSVGYIHARVMSDTNRIGSLVSWGLMDGIWNMSYILGAVVVMLSINFRLALWVLAIVPLTALAAAFFQKKLVVLNRRIREINSQITGNFNEGITGAKTTKTLVIEEKMEQDFSTTTSEMRHTSVHAMHYRALFSSMISFSASLALALVLWRGGIITLQGVIEIGTLSVFMSYALGMMEPVQWIVRAVSDLITVQVNVERFTRLMETRSDVRDTPQVEAKYGDSFEPRKENWEPLNGDITFEDVSFKYPDGDEYVLEHFNLHVPQGTNVAIVGETGAGKSTLVNLVCRFFEPTSGRILIDGRDARERSQLWLHSNIGYVLQTPHLFSGTVLENLRYGNPDATMEQIEAAVRSVSADGVIARMDKGYDSDVGEGGDLLSTGEKQLLSFARAILADPRIFVLDEATSSIDTVTEKLIQDAIEHLMKGRTSFVIAHRLSTIRQADVILVVHDGKIIEQGTHPELIAKKGAYYNLYTRQFQEEAVEDAFEGKA